MLKALAIIVCLTFPAAIASGQSGPREPSVWTCPPCACSLCGEAQEAAGDCAECGMALVSVERIFTQRREVQRLPAPALSARNVAVLVFPGVELIDFAGPYEVFGQGGFRPYLVGVSKEPIRTSMGVTITPQYDFSDCPESDVLVLPGGGIDSAQNSEPTMAWIEEQGEEAAHVLTVCNGAFFMAENGSLDGMQATTFHRLIPSLQAAAPAVEVLSNRRFVDNGKIVTTAGLSSGIDGAMYMVEKLRGRARAQLVALNLEYDWKPGGSYARADFVDMGLIRAGLLSGGSYPMLDAEGTRWRLVNTAGDSEAWSIDWEVATEMSAEALAELMAAKLRDDAGWEEGESGWEYVDAAGRSFVVEVRVDELAGVEDAQLSVGMRIGLKG